MIEVLIVEDSRVTREYLERILQADPAIRVQGAAGSGEDALRFLESHRPDAILMDIHLPGIDGLETTRRIMGSCPAPIVVCTASSSLDEVDVAMRALEAGALAALRKPRGPADPRAEAEAAAIVATLKLMAEVKVVRRWSSAAAPSTAAAPAPAPLSPAGLDAAVIAIGASTGGPPVVVKLLSALATALPVPVLLVQHISPGFTEGFAEWLATSSGLPVHVARGGETPLPGHVYVAPDGRHLLVGPGDQLVTARDVPLHGMRPSVGALFRSVASRYGRRAIGVLLSGMGTDGAEELKLMADQGALTIAQDEPSSVVFGMAAEAIRLGAVCRVLPPAGIAELLLTVTRGHQVRGSAHG